MGKENIDGKKYIKFSLEDEKGISKSLYYIDIEKRVVSKIEHYNGYQNKYELYQTTYYTYSFNTVKEEDINNFNLNNYTDYEYIELRSN